MAEEHELAVLSLQKKNARQSWIISGLFAALVLVSAYFLIEYESATLRSETDFKMLKAEHKTALANCRVQPYNGSTNLPEQSMSDQLISCIEERGSLKQQLTQIRAEQQALEGESALTKLDLEGKIKQLERELESELESN